MARLGCILMVILLSHGECMGKTEAIFKKVMNSEMQNKLGIIRRMRANSRIHCAHHCIQTENCTAFQIEKSVGQTKDAHCVLVNDDYVDAIETTTSIFDYYQDINITICKIKCFNGGIILKASCTCRCPTTPIITRGLNCEYVCHWKEYPKIDISGIPAMDRYYNLGDVQLCQAKCLQLTQCFTSTIHLSDCFVKHINSSDEKFEKHFYRDTNYHTSSLHCSIN